MNRFRTKRRAKDDSFAGRTSEDSEQPSTGFMGFRKGKKVQQEEVKLEIDLSTALPSNDDFRTSLLMSNLSARFSMLREQDDPNTKIGKASDDSVLYPKRQSRMADFGFGGGAGLSDIAEVESIKGPHFLRNSSASNDTDQEGGSVMDRSRPTEGNNLFGGRQKIYKIPAGAEGGMTGRALYDDDVAMSSFQRWKQAEREKALGELNNAAGLEQTEEVGELPKSPVGYNRKRETSSTTSSASITGRNSTAATSVTSQAAGGAKDGQSAFSAPTSAAPAPVERSVTRTRRLYEQALTQDMHEQQASALSRIESLNRHRPFGTRTPDLSMNPAPQPGAFPNGSVANTRNLLAKASASSLKSASPPATTLSVSGLNTGTSLQTGPKLNLGASPPLSPPISETGEQAIPPVLPKDVGKAAAGSVFQKSSHPYNESQYIQRQLQLQQGRETPSQRLRTESNAANASKSQDLEAKPAAIGPRSPAPEARLPPTPVIDTETSSSAVASLPGLSLLPEVNVERPSDNDHPAFRRQSAMPTPLHIGAKSSREPSPSPTPKISIAKSQQPSPEDSPTLGPGLSGLVRQHLRTESVESSVSGAGLDISGPDSRFHLDSNTPSVAREPELKASPWPSSGQEWSRSQPGHSPEAISRKPVGEAQPRGYFSRDSQATDRSSNATDDGTDEFASQLADARRRVREKLTSYVESDSSRAGSPLPSESPNLSMQAAPNPLGINILKPKSSRGSLVDRSRNMMTGQSKGLKILGMGAGTTSTPPQSAKQSLDEKEIPVLETMKEEVFREDSRQASRTSHEAENSSRDQEDESNTHPGLRAFKQARRELQKRKELETLARHQASQTSQSPDQPLEQVNGGQPQARTDRRPRQRTPSRERRPPPVTYRQHPTSDEHSYNSPGSTRPSGERDRSGSETSGGRSNSRPPRLRTNTNTGQHPGPHDQLAAPNYRQPMMRSPGLPGTDIKGSPMMPPYPYASRGAPSPAPSPHLHQARSAANLGVHTGRSGLDPHSGQPSPISPMGLPSPAPYAMGPSPAGTPTSLGPRLPHPPSHQPPHPPYPAHSQYPPLSQYSPHSQYPPHPHQPPPMIPGMTDGGRPYGGSRSRSNSRAAGPAPPLPPINPRRRRDDSSTRPSHDDPGMSGPRLPFANQQANNSAPSFDQQEDDRGTFLMSEDERSGKPDQRRRLQKPRPDMQGPGPRPFGRPRDNSPPFAANGPPASRAVATSNAGGNSGMGPGGMI